MIKIRVWNWPTLHIHDPGRHGKIGRQCLEAEFIGALSLPAFASQAQPSRYAFRLMATQACTLAHKCLQSDQQQHVKNDLFNSSTRQEAHVYSYSGSEEPAPAMPDTKARRLSFSGGFSNLQTPGTN
eukprot:1149710-Pelagomonas_calceolata.AAC.2